MARRLNALTFLLVLCGALSVAGAAGAVTVKAESVNLYGEPNTSAKVLATVGRGAELQVLEPWDEWYRVANPGFGYAMYVQKRDLEVSPSAPATGTSTTPQAAPAVPNAPVPVGLTIDHKGVACMIVGKFPELLAKLEPADHVARARVDFHAEGDTHWYYVDMTPKGSLFKGVLPKPLKATKKVHYYLEAAHKALGETRTEEYVSDVVDSAGVCADPKKVAGALASASLKVWAAPGAPAVPSGFASVGVAGAAAGASAVAAVGAGAAAGGGLSGAAIVGIAVAGAGAVAGGVVLATHKSSSPPTTTFAGTLSGFTQTQTEIGTDPKYGPFNCTAQLTWGAPPDPLTMTITDSGGSGTITAEPFHYDSSGTPPTFCNGIGTGGTPHTTNLQVTVSGTTVMALSEPTPRGQVFTLRGTRAGTTISGTFTVAGGSCDPGTTTCNISTASGTFTASKQ